MIEINPTGNLARSLADWGMSPSSTSACSFVSSVLPMPASSVARPSRASAATETDASRTERAALR